MNRMCAVVIAGVMTRVQVHLLEARDGNATQPFFNRARRCDGQPQHTYHRSGLHAAEMRPTRGDRLGGNSSLTTRRSCQR